MTIRKPTPLDFTDERFAIGDRTAAVTKQNSFSDEMEEFSRQVNDEMIPDIEALGEAANDAATSAASSATAATDSASASAQSALDASNAAETAAGDAAVLAAEAFNATVVNDAIADVSTIQAGGQIVKNRRYYLPAGSSAIMPIDCENDDWLELIPAGDLVSNPASVTFGHAVQDNSGQSLAAGAHHYNSASIRKFVFKDGGWL